MVLNEQHAQSWFSSSQSKACRVSRRSVTNDKRMVERIVMKHQVVNLLRPHKHSSVLPTADMMNCDYEATCKRACSSRCLNCKLAGTQNLRYVRNMNIQAMNGKGQTFGTKFFSHHWQSLLLPSAVTVTLSGSLHAATFVAMRCCMKQWLRQIPQSRSSTLLSTTNLGQTVLVAYGILWVWIHYGCLWMLNGLMTS